MISWQLKVTLALFVFVLSALASAIPNGRAMAATAEQHAGTFLRTKSVGEDAPALAEGIFSSDIGKKIHSNACRNS